MNIEDNSTLQVALEGAETILSSVRIYLLWAWDIYDNPVVKQVFIGYPTEELLRQYVTINQVSCQELKEAIERKEERLCSYWTVCETDTSIGNWQDTQGQYSRTKTKLIPYADGVWENEATM